MAAVFHSASWRFLLFLVSDAGAKTTLADSEDLGEMAEVPREGDQDSSIQLRQKDAGCLYLVSVHANVKSAALLLTPTH